MKSRQAIIKPTSIATVRSEDDGEEEGDQEHRNIALRILHQRQETSPSAHSVGYDNQYTGKTCHRDVFGKRHQEEEYQQQYHSMNDAGNWSLTTIINIGHGTGDGTCGWDSAKEWGSEVSQNPGLPTRYYCHDDR